MSSSSSSRAPGELSVRRTDGIVRLTITREQRRNALNSAVLTALNEELRAVGEQDRVVLIASAGEKVFCSGADLAVMREDATGLENHEARGGLKRAVLTMRDCPLPVVVRVQGLCLAGGVGLALGADLVVAAQSAAFGLPEVNLGIWPFMVSALLARHVSPKVAMDLMLSGERISAERALEVGLISRVAPGDTLDEVVEHLCATLAAKPPVAVRLGKAAFHAAQETTLAAGLEAMQAQLALLTQTADAAEGIGAFFAKRPPVWSGR